MSTVFLIGNGFDLNSGLKTKYENAYEGYISTPSTDEVIKRFKDDIRRNHETWGDFEGALPYYARKLGSENEALICVRDFKRYLNRYLIQEQVEFLKTVGESFAVNNAVVTEFRESLRSYYEGITHSISYLMQSQKSRNGESFSFISFNYTTVFNNIVSSSFNSSIRPRIINIHGTIDTYSPDFALGVDNDSQLIVEYGLTNSGKRGLIKTCFNDEYDRERVQSAKDLIKEADDICVFGMSLGDSDLTWRNMILSQLKEKENLHVFLYQHELSEKMGLMPDERMDLEEIQKRELLKKWCVEDSDAIFGRIHIPVGKNIFNIKDAVERGMAKEMEAQANKPIVVVS